LQVVAQVVVVAVVLVVLLTLLPKQSLHLRKLLLSVAAEQHVQLTVVDFPTLGLTHNLQR
jgi:hypothetical protein